MVKKAYLVTFTTTTRVVLDVPENFDVDNYNSQAPECSKAFNSIIKNARNNILEVPRSYLYGDNADIEEDSEVPYEVGE